MSKEDVIKKINEILAKDERFHDEKVIIEFKDKTKSISDIQRKVNAIIIKYNIYQH